MARAEAKVAQGATEMDGQQVIARPVEESASVAFGKPGWNAVEPEVGLFLDDNGFSKFTCVNSPPPPIGQTCAIGLHV